MFTQTQESIHQFLSSGRFTSNSDTLWSEKCPLCFQRYANETLEGLRGLKFIAYLDEILVYFNKAFDEQLEIFKLF